MRGEGRVSRGWVERGRRGGGKTGWWQGDMSSRVSISKQGGLGNNRQEIESPPPPLSSPSFHPLISPPPPPHASSLTPLTREGGGHCLFEGRYPKHNYRPPVLCYHSPLSLSLLVYSPLFLRHQRKAYC